MKMLYRILFLTMLTLPLACSDGTQIGSHVTGLIDERNTDNIPGNDIVTLCIDHNGTLHSFPIERKWVDEQEVIDGQFVVLEDVSINLDDVRTVEISGDSLMVSF